MRPDARSAAAFRLSAIVLVAAAPAAGAASPSGSDEFERLGPPTEGEWRAVFAEPVQTFTEYALTARRSLPFEARKIVLLPLGAPAAEGETAGDGRDARDERGKQRDEETLAELAGFLGAFYMTRVETEERAAVPEKVPRRTGRRFGRQVLADEVLRSVRREMPVGAVARLAVASDDLYARRSGGGHLNFVFGLGAFDWRVAVCSRARLGSAYPGEPVGITPRKRLLKIASHELGHVFGLAHCQTYRCAMNGFNSLEEFDARPVHLCPECLDKLSYHLGFDRAMRYRALLSAYRRLGWEDEAAFASRRASAEGALAVRRPGRAGEPRTASRARDGTPAGRMAGEPDETPKAAGAEATAGSPPAAPAGPQGGGPGGAPSSAGSGGDEPDAGP